MIVRKLLTEAQKRLKDADIPESYAKYVLNEIFLEQGKNLYDQMDETLDPETENRFMEILERLCKDEPLAYVMGVQYFYGYPLEVNRDVLIPRYETEELVMRVLMEIDDYFPGHNSLTLLDIGTGSGAIACALKAEVPALEVKASDISEKALDQARRNAQKLGLDIGFYQGDMAKPFIEAGIKADILVCNPPYIPQNEVIENSVKSFEPHVALFGGEDGLYFYRSVLSDAPMILNKKSILAFEIGWDQKDKLTSLALNYFPQSIVECYQDMNGKDRILIIRNI